MTAVARAGLVQSPESERKKVNTCPDAGCSPLLSVFLSLSVLKWLVSCFTVNFAIEDSCLCVFFFFFESQCIHTPGLPLLGDCVE